VLTVQCVQSIQPVRMLTWQGRTTRHRAELAGPYDMWQVLVGSWMTNLFLTHGIGGEWNDDTSPKQWSPRVTLAMV
jgi:hypothetical protein